MNAADIGKFFKRKRKEKSLTQLNIAERLLVSPQAVSKWERGECLPDITLLPEIAKIFGITVADILDAGSTKEMPTMPTKNTGAKSELSDVLRQLNAFVNDELFAKVLSMFRSAGRMSELEIPPEFLMVLNNAQKSILLDSILEMEDCGAMIDEIFMYVNPSQRENIVRKLSQRGDFGTLEQLLPYMTASIKTELTTYLLKTGNTNFLEEMLPFLSRTQREIILNWRN